MVVDRYDHGLCQGNTDPRITVTIFNVDAFTG